MWVELPYRGWLPLSGCWGQLQDTVWYVEDKLNDSKLRVFVSANIEKFLRNQNTSVEFLTSLANIEETCQVENSGSTTWKEINLLVFSQGQDSSSILSSCFLYRDSSLNTTMGLWQAWYEWKQMGSLMSLEALTSLWSRLASKLGKGGIRLGLDEFH